MATPRDCPRCGHGLSGPGCSHCGLLLRAPGRRRSAWLVGVLHVLTLGVSSLVWLVVAAAETDRLGARNQGLAVAGAIAAGAGYAGAFGLYNFVEGLFPPLQVVLLLASFLVGLAGLVLVAVAFWRVLDRVARTQRHRGVEPVSPGGLTALALVPHAVMSVVAPFLMLMLFVGLLAGVASGDIRPVVVIWSTVAALLVLPHLLTAVAVGRAQAGMNRLWSAPPRPT